MGMWTQTRQLRVLQAFSAQVLGKGSLYQLKLLRSVWPPILGGESIWEIQKDRALLTSPKPLDPTLPEARTTLTFQFHESINILSFFVAWFSVSKNKHTHTQKTLFTIHFHHPMTYLKTWFKFSFSKKPAWGTPSCSIHVIQISLPCTGSSVIL